MIYRALLRNPSLKTLTDEIHLLGEQLLAYGLLLEKGLVYNNESVIKNEWGKPSLKNYPGIQYNISHSENYAACIISDTYSVGIDVEKVRNFSTYAAKRVCSHEELNEIYSKNDSNREFFRYWTLKESYIKAIGVGMSYSMKHINFHIGRNGEVSSNVSNCSFQLMEDTKEFITAVSYTNKVKGK